MRIVAINASHRGDKGFTRQFIDRIFTGARQAGAECEVLTLARFKINRCLSCYECQLGSRHLTCVYQEKDDVQHIFDRLAAADRVIFGTPVYLMNMSGLLKTLLDRMYATMDINAVRLSNGLIHHHINPAISSKPFVPLVVCSNLEDETWRSVTGYFRTYARFMETRQVGVLVRNASPLFDLERSPQYATEFPKVPAVLAAFEQAGRELAATGAISRHTQHQARQEVIPVPYFWLLKRFKPIKLRVLEYLRQHGQ